VKMNVKQNFFDSLLKKITRGMNIAGMVVLVAMMLLSVADVLLRAVFNHPIVGGTELSEFFMVCLVLGTAWCVLSGRSIKMDMVVERFPVRGQAVIDSITYLISLTVVSLMTWGTVKDALFSKDMGDQSTILKIPNYPTRFILAFAFFMLVIVLLTLLVKTIARVVKR
jgi:TRAP-type C4-dicarboxylate transport system permease small subunit